jgi:hypothetical protein
LGEAGANGQFHVCRVCAGGRSNIQPARPAQAATDLPMVQCTDSHTIQLGFGINWLASPSGSGGRTLFRGC